MPLPLVSLLVVFAAFAVQDPRPTDPCPEERVRSILEKEVEGAEARLRAIWHEPSEASFVAGAKGLIELARRELARGNGERAADLAHHVYLSASPDDLRRVAWGLMAEHASPEQWQEPEKPRAKRTIILETPGVTCFGRFQDSLREHMVQEHAWMHRVVLKNLDAVDPFHDRRRAVQDEEGKVVWGDTLWVFFEVDADVTDERLVKTVAGSGYYVTQGWKVIERRAIR